LLSGGPIACVTSAIRFGIALYDLKLAFGDLAQVQLIVSDPGGE